MAQFYKAEMNVFKPRVVAEAFRKFGLCPWSPESVRKKCEQNCPPRTEQISDESVKAAVCAIKECEKEKLQESHEMVDDLEPVPLE